MSHLSRVNQLVASSTRDPYCKFALVRINDLLGTALIDSGNTWRTVISLRLAESLGYNRASLAPLNVGKIGTANANSDLKVLGELPTNLHIQFHACPLRFKVRPAVIENLSMPLNISGPFLKRHNIDQLHSKDCLTVQNYRIPLLAADDDFQQFECSTSPIVTADPVTIPPYSVVHIFANVPALQNGRMPKSEGCVSGSLAFMQKYDCHPWINAMVSPSPTGQIPVGIFNTLSVPVHIPANTTYGEFLLSCPEDKQERFPWRVSFIDKAREQFSKPKDDIKQFIPDDTEKPGTPAFIYGPTTKNNIQARRAFIEKEFALEKADCLKSKEQTEKAVQLILNFFDVFSFDGSFGTTDLIEHTIYTQPGPPINQRYRPVNPALEPKLKEQLDEWLTHDVIEESSSPWNFGLVAVPKKNGKIRWCIDYRQLNQRSIRDTHPIGSIEDNLVRLGHSTVFSGLDASGAFHVVPLEEKSKPKTAFSTPFGSYQFKRLPFGLANGPATYARLVKLVLNGIPTSMALPYLDDVIVHSPDVQKHFQDLAQVFKSYRKAGLKLQPAKCQLFRAQIDYLGHTVSAQGIAPLNKYIDIVKNWPPPDTRHAIRAFLGKVGYYRRFIKDFAAIAKPLTDKLAQDGTGDKAPFEVTPEMKSSFSKLRLALTTAPILAYPRFDSKFPFIVDTDWSMENSAIGGVLSQVQDGHERVIAYGAHKLLPSQTRYGVTKGELYAIIYFLQYWKYFLQYRPFLVRTDHMSLKYIHSMEAPTGMIQRWLYILSSYQFTIQHRPGKKHANADGLSRAPHLRNDGKPSTVEDENQTLAVIQSVKDPYIVVGEIQESFRTDDWKLWSPSYLLSHQENDPDIAFLFPHLKENTTPEKLEVMKLSPVGRVYAGLFQSLALDPNGLIRYEVPAQKSEPQMGKRNVLILPFALIKPTVFRVHRSLAHLGAQATFNKLKLYVYFPNMLQSIRNILMLCGPCQTKTTRVPDQRHTLFSRQTGYPFQTLSIDFVGPFPPSAPHKYIYLLTIKDTFTRWLEAFPLKQATAANVVKILTSEIFPRFGYCEKIHSDRGSQFTSEMMKETMESLKIQVTYTPAYNAKSNPVERSHRDLKAALNAATRHKPSEWPNYLPAILYALRSSRSASTGFSPFQLMYGRDPIEDLDLIMPSPTYLRYQQTAPAYFDQLTRSMTQAHHLARENMATMVQRQRKNYSRKVKHFDTNQQVWLFTPILHERKTPKFVTGWSGPWTILRRINDLMYEIKFDDARYTKRIETVSIDRLREYYADQSSEPIPPPPGPLRMDGDEFTVSIPMGDYSSDQYSEPEKTREKKIRPTLGESNALPAEHKNEERQTHPKTALDHTSSQLESNKLNTTTPDLEWDNQDILPLDDNYDAVDQWVLDPNFIPPEITPVPKARIQLPNDKDIPPIRDLTQTEKLSSAPKLQPSFDEVIQRYRPNTECQQHRRDRYIQREARKQEVSTPENSNRSVNQGNEEAKP